MAETDSPFHNPGGHPPGEVNPYAWDKAEMARRVVQARRTAKALDSREAELQAETAEQALRERATDIAQQQYDRMALTEDTQANLLERTPITRDEEWIRQKLARLGDLKPGTPEFYKAHRVQPPEPVMMGYVPSPGEGKAMVQSRVWAVDSDAWVDQYEVTPKLHFGKLAGQEMTDEEYHFVNKARYPVNWNKDGEPADWNAAHDGRDMPELVEGVGAEISLTEATAEEREQSKQYAVTAYIPGGTGDPDIEPTEHVILPDPPAELTE